MKQRNMSLELMRLCMVFGIVLLHVITQSGYLDAGGAFTRKFINLLYPCVAGFVFISGYFGIRFSYGKAMRLIGLLVLYVLVFSLPFDRRAAMHRMTDDWFLYSYLVLMTLSPLFNAAFEGKDKKSIVMIGMPYLVAVYGWGWLCTIPWVKDFVPCPTGMTQMSFFALSGIYVAARMFRLLELEQRLGRGVLCVFGVVCAVAVFVGFHHHNSLSSLGLVICVFLFFKNLSLPIGMSRLVALLAPSAFAVYLLHSSVAGRAIFTALMPNCVKLGMGAFIAYFVDTVLVVSLCFGVDLIRRCIVKLFSRRKDEKTLFL